MKERFLNQFKGTEKNVKTVHKENKSHSRYFFKSLFRYFKIRREVSTFIRESIWL